MSGRSGVLIGNVVICASNLRNSLKKAEYCLTYDEGSNSVELSTRGFILMQISNVPYESAVRLANELGLKNDSKDPTYWTKWNPHLHLEHDGSADAELLWTEILKLGIPHRVQSDRPKIVLSTHGHCYTQPSWSTEKMLQIIREEAERSQKELSTTP